MLDIPVPTLYIYNLLTYNQEPPNFVIFPKIYVKTIWYDMSLFIRLMLPWQLHFDRHFFQKIEFSCFVMKYYNFIAVTFTFLDHLSVLLLVIVFLLGQLWWFLEVVETLKKTKMVGPTWLLPFGNHDTIPKSYDIISSCCRLQRKHFWMYHVRSKVFVLKASTSSKLRVCNLTLHSSISLLLPY